MKVLFLNISESSGGAGRAAHRLYKGLDKSGVHCRMFVRDKSSGDENIITENSPSGIWNRIKPHIERLPFKLYPKRKNTPFYFQWNPGVNSNAIPVVDFDIIHLHWICGGFMRIETLAKLHKPIVWTLHDMWPFTGGCNHSWDCDRYMDSCGKCPQLGSNKDSDLSRWVWERKRKSWDNLDMTIVTPSRWMAKCAGNSSLFKNLRIEVIPNGLDINQYKQIDKIVARDLLNLPKDKKLILFGSLKATSDIHKGAHFLKPALEILKEISRNIETELIIFGSGEPNKDLGSIFHTHQMGRMYDDTSLALLYSAADVFVAPSEQDNLPNTVMEALACGTPCVAFNIGGMPDMIEHKKNGYLAKPFSSDDFGNGIAWVLEDNLRYRKLSNNARKTVKQKFDINTVARRYNKLYEEILS